MFELRQYFEEKPKKLVNLNPLQSKQLTILLQPLVGAVIYRAQNLAFENNAILQVFKVLAKGSPNQQI